MKNITPKPDKNLLSGFDTSDDAAVYRLNDYTAAVLTLDFFTPVVDDPYEFGAIAAANALSDIYAMGARPISALNILAFPRSMGTEVVARVLQGGADKVSEAEAFVVGGHSIEDNEPKYGLSVFGTVHPDHIIFNHGAQVGDVVFYTKKIGSGISNAALKSGKISERASREVIESMMELNRYASEAMIAAGAHAATDVTGFGLVGHLHEMLAASKVSATITWDALPLFNGIYDLSCKHCRPGKTADLISWAQNFVKQEALSDEEFDNRMGVLCDPQTSGGLLVALDPCNAPVFARLYEKKSGRVPICIGQIEAGVPGSIHIR